MRKGETLNLSGFVRDVKKQRATNASNLIGMSGGIKHPGVECGCHCSREGEGDPLA